MSARPVQAIFLWRFNLTAFAATYGRAPARGAERRGETPGSYTKNFLQCPSNQQLVLDRVLGRQPTSEVKFQFSWPGGTRSGHWQKSAADNRGQLFWDQNSNPPDSWKVGNPAVSPACTIKADPSRTTVAEANAEFKRIGASNTKPILMLVKLWGEERYLYPRVFLTNPPPNQAGRGYAALPKAVRQHIETWLESNDSAFAQDFGEPHVPVRAPMLVERIVKALRRDPNVLLVGPPGTGKTVALEDLRMLFNAKYDQDVLFNPEAWDNAWSEGGHPAETGLLPADNERMVEPLVFHPSYGFEEFVAGLVPNIGDGGQGIRLEAKPGPLLSLAHWASSPGRRALLIIDEFNRGPAASILGNTLALLDGSKRRDLIAGQLGASISRPYPHASMRVAPNYKDANGRDEIGLEVTLPSSLWIAAAMNSADRSVAPLDAALRRRFSIIYVGPDYDALALRLGLNAPPNEALPELGENPERWNNDEDLRRIAALTVHLLTKLNERIAAVLGQDFLLGHALLWDVRRDTSAELLDALATAFDERIAATLRLTFLDQDEALAAVLNAGPLLADSTGTQADGARVARWRPPPRGLEAVTSPRLELKEVSTMSSAAKLQALQALLL